MPVVDRNPKNQLDHDTILIEHLWEFKNIPPSEGVRTAEWKYFRYVNDKSAEELYNLKVDPKEINNLAAKSAIYKCTAKFREKTDQLAEKYADPLFGKTNRVNRGNYSRSKVHENY